MTTDTKTIAELELALAEKTQKCLDCNGSGISEWFEGTSPDSVRHEDSCLPCNSTGVVELIAGSRRDCEGNGWPYGCVGGKRIPLGTLSSRKVSSDDCDVCHGRGWIPDLDMGKVLAFMLETDEVLFVKNHTYWGEALGICIVNDPYTTLLRACLEGVKAMEVTHANEQR